MRILREAIRRHLHCLQESTASPARLLMSVGIVLCLLGPARAEQDVQEVESRHFEIRSDYSYKLTIVRDLFVKKHGQIDDASKMGLTYDPGRTSVRLVEGWVEATDGTRHHPAADAVFTRPSAASRDAPGFVSSVTTTVVMPKVEVGSHVHYEVEETVAKLGLMGFNPFVEQDPFRPGDEFVTIDLPADLPLTVGSQGGFVVSDTTAGGRRHISAASRLRNVSLADKEPHMVPETEFAPLFLATSLKNYDEAGAIYYRVNESKAAATPEIEALAKHIVGERTGIDAAQAVYDWVAHNVRYLAVYRTDDDGDVSHDAATVLKNGYGDCKDHVTLMQAMLKSVGVRAEPALIDWSNRTKPLPLWSSRETNHVIVYLPDFDVFANPTSPFTPFGVLDQGLSNKLAIIASGTPEVRHTPAMVPDTATFSTMGDIRMAADGTVTGEAKSTMSPALSPLFRSVFQDPEANRLRIDRILSATLEGGFGHLKTTDPFDTDHPFEVTVDWKSPHGINPAAGAFVLPTPPSLDPIDEPRSYLSHSGARHTPMSLPVRNINWTYSVTLPESRRIASQPKNVVVVNDLGSYTATYENRGNTLLVQRRLVLKEDELAPREYPEAEALIYGVENDLSAIVITTAATQDPTSDGSLPNFHSRIGSADPLPTHDVR